MNDWLEDDCPPTQSPGDLSEPSESCSLSPDPWHLMESQQHPGITQERVAEKRDCDTFHFFFH